METSTTATLSPSSDTSDHDLMLQLLAENQQLLKENNELLRKQERRAKNSLVLKIVWYAILLGLPIILYYYLYNTFIEGFFVEQTPLGGIQLNTDSLQQALDLYRGQ